MDRIKCSSSSTAIHSLAWPDPNRCRIGSGHATMRHLKLFEYERGIVQLQHSNYARDHARMSTSTSLAYD